MDSFHNSKSNIDTVINNGIKYLLSQNNEGRWKGFPTLAGTSDIWVTGFVLAHISNLFKQEDIIKESQEFLLKSSHTSGAWSYSAAVPPDADSSAWCLLALQSCNELKGFDLEKTKSFLWSHFIDQGISTYITASGIGEFISAPNNEAISGWTSAHPDVSIAAVLADINNENVTGILNWLKEQQINAGLIDSYWWRVPYYTTALLLRALSIRQEVLPQEHAQKIVKVLVDRQLSNGGFGLDSSKKPDAFSTAMALELLCHLSYLGTDKEKDMCINALIQSQQPNGAWEGNFILRIPSPNISNPNLISTWSTVNGGGNSYVEDQNGIFATAMACYALDCWRQPESSHLYKGSITKSSTI
jgi:hypothetical protein